jgi:hypothetical protein
MQFNDPELGTAQPSFINHKSLVGRNLSAFPGADNVSCALNNQGTMNVFPVAHT